MRIDRAEEVGKVMITVGGKRKEIKVNQTLLNRKEEQFIFGNGQILCDSEKHLHLFQCISHTIRKGGRNFLLVDSGISYLI